MLSDKIDIPKYLNDYGIRPTAVRIMVFRAMYELHDTFSLTDLENTLDSVDKSTLFRTLSLFAQHHLVHKIEGGSGSTKYCLCRNDHVCRVAIRHTVSTIPIFRWCIIRKDLSCIVSIIYWKVFALIAETRDTTDFATRLQFLYRTFAAY